MSEFVADFFTATTAEDQKNYFYGEEQEETPSLAAANPLLPGTYRVIDGMLCKILSGLSADDVLERLRASNKTP
jgi:hypothetical protein